MSNKPTTNPTAPAPSCSLQGGAGDSFTVDYFIEKFEKIPEGNWISDGTYHDDDLKCFCALGHCGFRHTRFQPYPLAGSYTKEGETLDALFSEIIGRGVTEVNDCESTDYPQPTPKQRILAALRDIKAKQEAKQ